MSKEKVYFETEYGLKLSGQLVVPEQPIIVAAALCITGGKVTAEDMFSEWQEGLADAGIASLSFNARGIDGSDGVIDSEDPDYDPLSNPTNSLASRAVDARHGLTYLNEMDLAFSSTVIGTSMGGDIGVHLLMDEELVGQAQVRSIVLKGASAYPPQAHSALFGPELRSILRSRGQEATMSENFKALKRLTVPAQLVYAAGEEVVPSDIQDLYRVSLPDYLPNEFFIAGDETTLHGYFRQQDPVALEAKLTTIERSIDFILENA